MNDQPTEWKRATCFVLPGEDNTSLAYALATNLSDLTTVFVDNLAKLGPGGCIKLLETGCKKMNEAAKAFGAAPSDQTFMAYMLMLAASTHIGEAIGAITADEMEHLAERNDEDGKGTCPDRDLCPEP
jgi:hypothetical protein